MAIREDQIARQHNVGGEEHLLLERLTWMGGELGARVLARIDSIESERTPWQVMLPEVETWEELWKRAGSPEDDERV